MWAHPPGGTDPSPQSGPRSVPAADRCLELRTVASQSACPSHPAACPFAHHAHHAACPPHLQAQHQAGQSDSHTQQLSQFRAHVLSITSSCPRQPNVCSCSIPSALIADGGRPGATCIREYLEPAALDRVSAPKSGDLRRLLEPPAPSPENLDAEIQVETATESLALFRTQSTLCRIAGKPVRRVQGRGCGVVCACGRRPTTLRWPLALQARIRESERNETSCRRYR